MTKNIRSLTAARNNTNTVVVTHPKCLKLDFHGEGKRNLSFFVTSGPGTEQALSDDTVLSIAKNFHEARRGRAVLADVWNDFFSALEAKDNRVASGLISSFTKLYEEHEAFELDADSLVLSVRSQGPDASMTIIRF